MTAAKVRNRMDSKRIKTVMVTSMMENEGKSTIAANLALELSKMGKKVLLIDLDLRKPSQHEIFNRKGESFTGIAEWLKNKTDPEEKMVQIHNSNLFVLFNSQTFRNSLELMDYLSWKNWIKKMEQKNGLYFDRYFASCFSIGWGDPGSYYREYNLGSSL